jgi:hypothetical protein
MEKNEPIQQQNKEVIIAQENKFIERPCCKNDEQY